MPGVNVICAASFLAAVGDIRRFSTSRKLVGYLGLDPRVFQSGSSPAKGGRISKQGSPAARWALVEAAWSARSIRQLNQVTGTCPVLLADQAASTSAQRAAGEPCLEIRPPLAGELPDWNTRGSSPR